MNVCMVLAVPSQLGSGLQSGHKGPVLSRALAVGCKHCLIRKDNKL